MKIEKLTKPNEDKLIIEHFKKLGLKIIGLRDKNCRGSDCWAIGKNKAFSVEIKCARLVRKRTLIVDPVKTNRINDDLIAIVINNYVLATIP